MDTKPKLVLSTLHPQVVANMKADREADLYSEILDNETFPKERLSEFWINIAEEAKYHSCPLKHKIGLNDFAKAVSGDLLGDKPLSLFQFGVMCNCLEERSMRDLQLDVDDYLRLATETANHIAFYRDKIEQIRAGIKDTVDKEFSMKLAAEEADLKKKNGKGVLSPVKGEA